jgi:hypothetical protein
MARILVGTSSLDQGEFWDRAASGLPRINSVLTLA